MEFNRRISLGYNQILNHLAESTFRLKPQDSIEALEIAYEQNCYTGFREYLLMRPLQSETRKLVTLYNKDKFELEYKNNKTVDL
ncbi:hypothetical protein [Cytobacillus purgationiresistens]|uniref:Uncharacterized protein n=1 Tax=Cytobacillus purgationiresistens TaxID=863449 RepID=A0ABU0AK68_9BACI|nr:hypothetical protein [Cytobacillus purgationiresistens]MDQ0271440.1 hypothetical protein [Cytobacillus purgationiresistens]